MKKQTEIKTLRIAFGLTTMVEAVRYFNNIAPVYVWKDGLKWRTWQSWELDERPGSKIKTLYEDYLKRMIKRRNK